MENAKIKKVLVELDNGNVLEFDKQVVLFLEDEMTETEKKLHSQNTKMCVVANCDTAFMIAVAESALGTLASNSPGAEMIPMVKFMEDRLGIVGGLAEILG